MTYNGQTIESGCIIVKTGYGQGNAGDDVVLEHYVEMFPNNQIVALCRDPNNYLANSFGKHVVFVGCLEHPTFAAARNRNFRGFNYGDGLETPDLLTNVFRLAKLVVFGHGAFFNEHHTSVGRGNLSEILFYTQLAVATGTPYILYHLNAASRIHHPFNQAACTFVLNNAHSIVFRDHQTLDTLARSDIHVPVANTYVGTDLVLGDRIDYVPLFNYVQRTSKILGIVPRRVRHLGEKIDQVVEQGLMQAMRKWLLQGSEYHVRLIPNMRSPDPDDYNDDYRYAVELRESLEATLAERVEVRSPKIPDDGMGRNYWRRVLYEYQWVNKVIAVRHHGAIFALLAGVPVIYPVNYDLKVSGFWHDFAGYTPVALDEIGSINFVSGGYQNTSATLAKIANCRALNREIHAKVFKDFNIGGLDGDN